MIDFFFPPLGSIWTKNKTNFEWWQVEVVFRVNGRGRLGADGFVSYLLRL